jgi:DNA gyrase/topoisomerase IV subunit B
MDSKCVYSASQIEVLEGLEPIRRRPGMYIGDLGAAGLHHLLWELVGNSLDEHLAGRASKIRVSVEGDLAEVEDDGRGLPVDPAPGRAVSMLEFLFTTLHLGATQDGHWPHVHVSPLGFGMGLAIVSALSEELEVEVWQRGYTWKQRYARGRAVTPLERGARTERTGTRIRFRPDSTIFKTTQFDRHAIHERLRELAIWNPQLTFELMSEVIREPLGTVRWLDKLADEQEIERDGESFVLRTVQDGALVEVAATWCGSAIADLRSFVGQNQTTGGGSHETGFWQGVLEALAGRTPGLFFRRSPRGKRWQRALVPGLLAVVHVQLNDPVFAGPTRNELTNESAREAVRLAVAEAFSKHLAQRPELETMLVERIQLAKPQRRPSTT